ncbi:MAG: DUF1972 domain-containing protein [Chloroflexi bacterium]|nr:DUF1972 domain-containing protein [Chloroflexota bacterium]
MKIALLGTRGIPASYSGFETCVEELGSRLVAQGHQVTVYCRAHHIPYREPTYKGMRLIILPTVRNKYLDTIFHTFLSSLHAFFQPYDIVLMFISGNSLVSFIPRLSGKKVVLNVDGLDWKRQKWPSLAKKYIQWAEFLATKLPNVMVTDSRVIQEYYRQKYGHNAPYIPYGSEVQSLPPGQYLLRFGLQPRRYFLFVGRLVPENCAHHLVEAFSGMNTDFKCVIVGDAPYAEDYIRGLKATTNPNVIFTGYLFGEGYRELGSWPYAFIETSGVGGTHPALLEAMALGNCVVAHNTPENLETIGDAGLAYDGAVGAASLRQVLQRLLAEPTLVEEYRAKARARVQAYYTWEAVTNAYENLFRNLLARDRHSST